MAGFHNDQKLIKIVDYIAKDSNIFIETGTNLGNSLYHMLNTHPHLSCFSCEPAGNTFKKAIERLKQFKKGRIFNLTSQAFLKMFIKKYSKLLTKNLLVWLDAHSKLFEWPLKDEIEFFTKHTKTGILLIDDFMVPNNPQFKFNKHRKQPYSFEYIKKFINKNCKFNLYYPKYKSANPPEKLTGWALLQIGTAFGRFDKLFPKLVTLGK
jgi:hypothetical protein